MKGGKEGALREERKWNRKCRGGGGRRLVSVPLSPIPFPSLLPPLIPHLLSCSVSFPLCIFLPMIPYTWLPLTPSLKELFHPPLSSIHLFLTGGQPTLQNTPCTHFPSVVRATMPLKLVGINLSLQQYLIEFSYIKAKYKNIWRYCFPRSAVKSNYWLPFTRYNQSQNRQ